MNKQIINELKNEVEKITELENKLNKLKSNLLDSLYYENYKSGLILRDLNDELNTIKFSIIDIIENID